jgi:ubiquinone/menaquinone biosynthesis C-methylase UbiE
MPPSAKVLDVGCGGGQSLIARFNGRTSFGLDVDVRALQTGRSLSGRICFTNGKAEALPYNDGVFDLVFARFSLPYTNIPASVREMRRVVKGGGQIWLALHPFSFVWKQALPTNYKGKLFFLYIVLNSLGLRYLQRQWPLLGRYESFQTKAGMRRILEANGFVNVCVTTGKPFLVTAQAK